MKIILALAIFLCAFSIAVFLSPSDVSSNAVEYKVESINKEKLQEIIKNRNGKALLVNIWATWCGPCREEFPELVKLQRNFKNKNLEIITISVDDKKEVDSKVIPFLKEQKSNLKVFINGFSKDEEFMDFFDKTWQGDIPVTMIYDSKGNRKAFLIGSQNYNTFKKKVEAAM